MKFFSVGRASWSVQPVVSTIKLGRGAPACCPARGNEKMNRVPSYEDAVLLWSALKGDFGGVHTVHTLGVGPGRMGVGTGRIPHVSGGAQCLQGLECSSSPTLGTA
jgi:hypothetical protein